MEQKFYFIVFMYGASEKKIYNSAINIHPFKWEKEANERYENQYVLLHWKEINGSEFLYFQENLEK